MNAMDIAILFVEHHPEKFKPNERFCMSSMCDDCKVYDKCIDYDSTHFPKLTQMQIDTILQKHPEVLI